MQTVLLYKKDEITIITESYITGLYVATYKKNVAVPTQFTMKSPEMKYHKWLRKTYEWYADRSTPIPDKPSEIKSIWDNKGETMDRYTVILKKRKKPGIMGSYECLGLSDNPTDPNGFSQFGEAIPGDHLGKRIDFYDLPAKIANHIITRIHEESSGGGKG